MSSSSSSFHEIKFPLKKRWFPTWEKKIQVIIIFLSSHRPCKHSRDPLLYKWEKGNPESWTVSYRIAQLANEQHVLSPIVLMPVRSAHVLPTEESLPFFIASQGPKDPSPQSNILWVYPKLSFLALVFSYLFIMACKLFPRALTTKTDWKKKQSCLMDSEKLLLWELPACSFQLSERQAGWATRTVGPWKSPTFSLMPCCCYLEILNMYFLNKESCIFTISQPHKWHGQSCIESRSLW